MALLGAALTRRFGKGIVVSGFEHPSVQKPLERLAAMGYDVTVVAPAGRHAGHRPDAGACGQKHHPCGLHDGQQ